MRGSSPSPPVPQSLSPSVPQSLSCRPKSPPQRVWRPAARPSLKSLSSRARGGARNSTSGYSDLVAPIVAAPGHEVIAREIEVDDVGAVTARERPDVALVGLGESSAHALGLIEKIVHEAACPVILLIHAPNPAFVKEASKRGIFAFITDAEAKDWQSSIDIVLRRFAEYQQLEGAFGRRAVIERAKGILMERHSVDEQSAFAMLHKSSRKNNRNSSTSPRPLSMAISCFLSRRRPSPSENLIPSVLWAEFDSEGARSGHTQRNPLP